MVAPFLFERITIIGLGLIGSSIARGARKYKLAETIVGCDENDVTLTFARSNGIIDVAMNDTRTAVRDSDLVILATPPSSMEAVVAHMAGSMKKGAMLMDTASVKVPVMRAIARHLPSHVDFIPAHPIAGSEQSGVRAGNPDLFKGKRLIVTPDEPLQDRMLQKVTSFWEKLGSRVEGIPPQLHDMVYGYVSHLPQLLAFGAIPIAGEHIADMPPAFMRLSRSDPKLWRDIFALNRDNVLAAIDRYLDALWHIKGELAQAPQEESSKQDDALARTILFPRIAASCLITTVMAAEKQAGFSFARYAGTGFADFTSPATAEPEGDIETISNHYLSVLNVIQEYISVLKDLRESIVRGDVP